MAYPDFHRIDPELEELDASANHGPVFHDTDGFPVYEDHPIALRQCIHAPPG